MSCLGGPLPNGGATRTPATSLDAGSGSSAAVAVRADVDAAGPPTLAYARPHSTLIFLGWLATILYGLSNAALVYMIKLIFDDVLIRTPVSAKSRPRSSCLYAIKGIGAYFSTTLLSEAGQKAVFDLRRAIYAHILDQSFDFFAKRTTGSLMSHLTTDIERIQTALGEIACDLLKEGLTVIGLVLVLSTTTGAWRSSRSF